MRVLLDTHALLWWLADNPGLSGSARAVMKKRDNTLLVSAASVWEIAIKFRLGKLPDAGDLLADFNAYMSRERFEILSISSDHAIRAGLLPGPHQDPFDRMLIAQSQAEDAPIISNDAAFDQYRIRRIW